MATFLDVGLLNFFQPLFIFLIVFAITYGLLEKTKMFGEGKSALHLIIAICLAATTIVVKSVSGMLGSIFPWFVLVFVVILMIFMVYGFFGIDQPKVWGMIGYTPILIIILVIVLLVLATTFEGFLSPYSKSTISNTTQISNVSTNGTLSATPTTETLKALTHPRIVGALLLLFITAAAAKLIVDKLKSAP